MNLNSILAQQSYAGAKPATLPEPGTGTAAGLMGDLAQDFAATLQKAEITAEATMTGGADPHALVEALAQSQLAIETAVTVRDRVVEAYQEILRMPV